MMDRPLTYLDHSDNLSSEILPDCRIHWNHLVILNLANNNHSGKFPRSIGLLH